MSEHSHGVSGAATKLKYGIIITAIILILEVAGGILSNSLALLSDAGHVFADGIALTLSWYGVRQAARPSSGRMTFGYHRVGVIIAIVNAVSILVIAGIILYEAYQRFYQQPEINSVMMLVIAVIGLGANIFVASWLHKEQKESLNIKSAFWHAVGDALASVGVIAGAIIIMLTKLYWVDAAVSVLISLIIIFAAWGMLTPRNLIVAGSLLACAISVSGATLLTLELDSPLTGWIRVSPVPMQEAISHLGQ